MIPAEAVEAAVSTLAEFTPEDEADSFDLKANDVWRGKVERILEAAAPYMLAEGWDAAADDIRHDTSIGDRTYVAHRIKANNPYMLNNEGEK